ncbi:MAG: prepilin-type N-terminal cleavage/methylation domain-containing protein [Betaproteobacteria bacterium]
MKHDVNKFRRRLGRSPERRRGPDQNGFTLIEISVVLVIVTLLLGSLLVPLAAQIEQRQRAETEKRLEEIKDALLGFAVANGYLPCPAKSAADGTEDRTTGVCGKRVGFLPWVTLGVAAADSWENLYRYSVDAEFANSVAIFSLGQKTDIRIRGRDPLGNPINISNDGNTTPPKGRDIPAVVISHGKNGFGATSRDGIARPLPATWTSALDEFQNANNSTDFWARVGSTNTALAYGQYDDLVVWISPNILFSRMVAAGRLP